MPEHTLHAAAFPLLSEDDIAQITACTPVTPRLCSDGEVLIAIGDRSAKLYIIKAGQIEVVDYSGDAPKVIAIHEKGGFTGDISHLTGTPAIVNLVARGGCEVLEISNAALRHVLNQSPVISDTILQAFIARRQLLRESPSFMGLRVIGSRYSPDTFRVRDFLARNRVLFTWVDIETDPEVGQLLKEFELTEADTPVVVCAHLLMLRNPTNQELADQVGIHQSLDHVVYDLLVVGAGPAGLAAAVYGASEGLKTAVLDSISPGGQAGSSMRIENYLGFPTGLTGAELTDRATLQANKFGAQLSIPAQARQLSFENGYSVLDAANGEPISAKCLLIATGAQYRRLAVDGFERYEGKGIYYAATPAEARICLGCPTVVVGGGNSAGQAAIYLAGHASKVLVIIRGDDLNKNMSSYLVRRIEQTKNIEVLCSSEISRMDGNGHLEAIEITNRSSGERLSVQTPAIFSFIGAVPLTGWLPPEIDRDSKGFVLTGATVAQSSHWGLNRAPFLLETSHPGVFAAGDVRAGSAKRVAAAVGEGAMSVQFVHEYLKAM